MNSHLKTYSQYQDDDYEINKIILLQKSQLLKKEKRKKQLPTKTTNW